MPRRNRVTPFSTLIVTPARGTLTGNRGCLHDEQTAYLVLRNQLLRWSPAGYEHPAVRTIRYPARVLTPASVVRTLVAGYPVSIHSSAFQAIGQSQQ